MGFILRKIAKTCGRDRLVYQNLNSLRTDAIQQITPDADGLQADIQRCRNAFFRQARLQCFEQHEVLCDGGDMIDVSVIGVGLIIG